MRKKIKERKTEYSQIHYIEKDTFSSEKPHRFAWPILHTRIEDDAPIPPLKQ